MKERIFTCQEHGLLTKENSYVHRAGDKYRWRCKKCEFAKAAIRRANKINVPCDIHGLTDRDSLGRCRKCRVVESVNYKKNNREIVRANFKKNYYKDLDKSRISNRVKNKNLTLEEYKNMLYEQDNKCKICNRPERRKGRSGDLSSLCIDHNHRNGVIRSLLCSDCNTGIGKLQDCPIMLRKAAAYLEWHEEKAKCLDRRPK